MRSPRNPVRKTLFRLRLWDPAYTIHTIPSSSSRRLPSASTFRLTTLNVHLLKIKYVPIADLIIDNSLDVMVIVEFWHLSSTDTAIHRAAAPSFLFLDRPRMDDSGVPSRGGGLIVYHRHSMGARRIELASIPSTFEALAVTLSSKRGPTMLLAIYHPGSSPSFAFFSELSVLLAQFAPHNTQLVITGTSVYT